jgi:hypothetical protein
VIGLPPLFAGGVNPTETEARPPLAAPMVGAPGTVAGTTTFDEADGALSPTAFVAITEHV